MFFQSLSGLFRCRKKVTRAIKNFLWTSRVDKVKLIIIAWTHCYFLDKLGGLGIKDLKLFKISWLSKFAWKFLSCDFLVFYFLRNQFLFNLRDHNSSYACSSLRLDYNAIQSDCH